MSRRRTITVLAASAALLAAACRPAPKAGTAGLGAEISRPVLLDKIKGGWAGQVIGCTFGGPTEFRYPGAMIADSMTTFIWT